MTKRTLEDLGCNKPGFYYGIGRIYTIFVQLGKWRLWYCDESVDSDAL